jgi:hypothetical protein
MPPAADDPLSDRTSPDLPETPIATPSADVPAPAPGNPPDAAAGGESAQADGIPASGLHRRRRRRRRRPQREGGPAPTGEPAAGRESDAAENAAAADEDRTGGDPAHLGESDAPPAAGAQRPAFAPHGGAGGGDRPHRHRRRHRPPPSSAAPAPGGLGSALPAAEAGALESGTDNSAEDEADGGAPGGERGSGRTVLRLRRPVRGRRQLPRPPGLQSGMAETPPPTEDMPADAAASADGAPAAMPRREGELPRRRRRRRPPLRPAGVEPRDEAQSASTAPREGGQPPRGDGRYRRPGESRAGGAQQQERSGGPPPREPGREPREREARGPGRRERSGRAERGPRSGQRGRGRDAAPRHVEQKLYALEAMVDRGFEDVPDEAEESGSRRVHWTIVKRTVADQKSGKAMSATYVLQREGEETEFPNLGAARAAANKTIVHPEKLTMSKAEHAAARNTGDRR